MPRMSSEPCRCSYCGEVSKAAVRDRTVGLRGFSYRHHMWRCSGCGREWEDDLMRRTNEVNASLFLNLEG